MAFCINLSEGAENGLKLIESKLLKKSNFHAPPKKIFKSKFRISSSIDFVFLRLHRELVTFQKKVFNDGF